MGLVVPGPTRDRVTLARRAHIERRPGETLQDCQLRISAGNLPVVRTAELARHSGLDEEAYDERQERRYGRERAKAKVRRKADCADRPAISEKTSKKISDAARRCWQDPEYRAKVTAGVRRSQRAR